MRWKRNRPLLRVLRSARYNVRRGNRDQTDVRIVAAHHKDLRSAFSRAFPARTCSFGRNFVPTSLPPVRERVE